METGRVSIEIRDIIMLVIALSTVGVSGCLYVLAVRYQVWVAVWSFGVTLLVFGIAAVVLFARLLWEAA